MERIPYRATAAAAPYEELRLPVSILLDNVRSMYNVGAFFRTADGAGIERLLLSGITARPPKSAIAKTALGAETRVAWESVEDANARFGGCETPVTRSRRLRRAHARPTFSIGSRGFPVCVLFGHEVDGLPEPLLEHCDTHVRIPMLGLKHSLNVASAGAVVMYELLRKYRALHR